MVVAGRVEKHQKFVKLFKLQTLVYQVYIHSIAELSKWAYFATPCRWSAYWATKCRADEKRGIFINVRLMVRDDNGKIQSEHQTPTFIHLPNNLNISPGEQRREAFTKTFLTEVRTIKWSFSYINFVMLLGMTSICLRIEILQKFA